MGVRRPRTAAAGGNAAVADGARRGVVRVSGAGAAGARPRPAGGGALRKPARLLHVRRRRRAAAGAHVHADAAPCASGSGVVPGARRRAVPGDGVGRPGRLRDGGLVQRRAVRRRRYAAVGAVGYRDGAGSVGPRLVGDRPVDPRDAVRARARPGQARAARGALHGPREDPAARRSSGGPAAARRVGSGEDGGRSRAGTRGSRPVARRADEAAQRRRASVPDVPDPAAGVHGTRSGVRLRELPLPGAAGAQGPQASGADRGRSGPRVPARVPGGRPGERQGHRDQPLRGGAGAGVGLDR